MGRPSAEIAQYSFWEDDSDQQSMQEIEGYKKLDASMANKITNDEDNTAILYNKKQS